MISGLVFDDFTGDGFDEGEEVSGAELTLHRDNGDGVFQQGSDAQVGTAISDSEGLYQFNRLSEGDYFVLQDAQTADGTSLQRSVSPLIVIDQRAVEGRIVRVIDNFDETPQEVEDSTADGQPVASSMPAPEAIGGERDMYVNKTSENGLVKFSVDNPLLPNLLIFDSEATGDGERRVTWDGPDDDPLTVDDTGLGTIDMTSDMDALGLQLQIGADQSDIVALVRLYSDDNASGSSNRFSTAELDIQPTGGTVPFFAEFIPFSSFEPTSGGGADINNVGAIELEIVGIPNVNGSAELVGTVGETVFVHDFDNFETADLRLEKSIDDSSPLIDQVVTFTITLNNDGPDSATGVEVRDQLPAGVEFERASETQGDYDSGSGIWTVGTIASGAVETLTIEGRIESTGSRTNTAQVSASDQFDQDSEPNNNNEAEDDQSSVIFATEAIDLELEKTGTPATVIVGNEVTFELTLFNRGPNDATNVVVQDQLPAGITYVRATESLGEYDQISGNWSLDRVRVGESATLLLVGRVDTTGGKTNTAQVLSADQQDTDSTPGNNDPDEDDQDSFTIAAPEIDLSLTKTVDEDMPNVGENITFTLVVSNAGPDMATGVEILDLLPNGLSYVDHSTVTGSYNDSSGIWNVGSIERSDNAMLTIIATADVATVLTNTAEVFSADQPDRDSTPNNQDPDEDDLDSVMIGAQQIDLSLQKAVDQSRPNVGDTIEFEIIVANDGQSDATGVVVEDILPSGLVFESADESTGRYDKSDGLWTIGDIDTGTSETLVIRARVDAVDVGDNIAQVVAADQVDADSTPDNDEPGEDDQDSVSVAPMSADLSLTKTVDNERPNVGQQATFTITVRNDGPDSATGVEVTDRFPSGIEVISSTPSDGTYEDGVWAVGTIGSGGQVNLEIVGLIETSGTKTNTAEVTAVDQFDPNSEPDNDDETEDDQASVTVDPPVIDLSLDKQIDIDRPNVGQKIRYTVVVNNDGPDDATGVVVADALPSGVEFFDWDATVGSYDDEQGLWTIGELDNQSSATLFIDAIVDTTETTTNVAEVFRADQFDSDSTPGDGNPNQDDYGSATFMLAGADLSLTKSVDEATPNVGDDVTFTIVVSNRGPDPATGVSVLDELPTGLTFVDADEQAGIYNPGSGIWEIGDLDVNESLTLTLVATSTTASPTFNVAEVFTSDQLDPDSEPGNGDEQEDDQSSVEVQGQQIDLSLNKEVDNERPNVGDQIGFTVTVLNSGPSQATGVSVRDALPEGLTYLSADEDQGDYSSSTQIWDIGTLNAGQEVTLQLFARVEQILSVINTAEVITADQPDLDSTPDNDNILEDDQDSAAVTTQVADLSLRKTVSNERPNVGEEFVFTLTVSNDGPDQATNVRVQDLLPDGLFFESARESQGEYNSQSGIWTVGDIDSRENASLEIVATVLNIGLKTNSAEVVAVDQADSDSTPGNNIESEDDQDSVSVDPPVIDLSLTKVATPLRPSVGGSLTFVIAVVNSGPDTATGIVIQDQLPEGVTFVSATESIGTFESSTGEWSVPVLAADSTATLQILTTVDQPGQPTNRVQVTAADQFDSDSTPGNDDGIDGNGNDEDDQAAFTVTTASADLSLSKSVDDDRPGFGSNVTFTIEVANEGPDDADNVVVEDLLPPGLSFVSADESSGDYSDVNGRWVIPTVATGRTETLNLVARVNILGDLINTAEIIASSQFDPDSTPDNNVPTEDDQDSVTLMPELVDLALSKIVDDQTPNVGDTVRFTLELSNEGPSTATEVEVTDRIPDGFLVTGINADQGVYDPGSGVWVVGSVAVGSRPQLQIDAVVNQAGPKTNAAEVTAVRQPDRDSTPNNGPNDEDDFSSVELIPTVADLELTQSVNNPTPNQNDELIFTIVLTNRGPDPATSVVVRNMVPAGINFIRSSQTLGLYDPGSGLWTIPVVPNDSTQSLQLVGLVESRDPINSSGEVIASDQFDPDSEPNNQVPTEDDIAAVVSVPRLIDVSVSATASNDEPEPFEVVEVVITVRNDGPDDATGLVVDVAVPDGLTILSADPERGTYNSPWDIGDLASGESVDLVLSARGEIRGTKPIRVEVISHDQADRDSVPANGELAEDDQTLLLIKIPLYTKRLFLGSS